MNNKMEKAIKKQVKSLSFNLMSPEKIKELSSGKIVTPELYDIDGYPVDSGLMDLRMGVIEPGMRCRTCGGTLKECIGHPGSIELARPVMHIKYIPFIYMILRSFCQDCGKFLLDNDEREKYNKKTTKKKINKSKDRKKCPFCNAKQEMVRLEKPTTFRIDKKRLYPQQVRERLAKIPDDELRNIKVDPKMCRPEWAVLTLLSVPPVTVRPSITLESGERSEDDLTHKLGDIIRSNQRLWENLNAGAPEVIIEDLWDLLQYHITTFFDNTKAGIPPARHRSGQPLKTITERIKGKGGRIRHNLTGKRVNYSSRSVISPDPFLEINEVGVPLEIAEVITSAERVNSLNIGRMKELIKKGSEYPGANYVVRPDGKKKKITPELKEELLEELEVGYIVERHLQDGDIVLFNRHPSLHKQSIMGHLVKVLPYKTFRLHPSVCHPYNADFDGDEMNIHGPQNEEAKSEAKILLNVNENLISSKNNTNLLGCVQDSVTGNFLLSKRKILKDDASQILFEVGVENELKKDLDGKDIFSEILPKINYEGKTKSCHGDHCQHYKNCKKEDCPYNAYLKIKNGKVEKGIIDENAFGVEGGELLKVLDRDFGREKALEILKKVFTIGTTSLSREGYSISLNDLKVNEKTKEETEKIILEAEKETNNIIDKEKKGKLDLIPGRDIGETRELQILKVLNSIRTKIGKIVREEMTVNNPVNTMIISGARGNILNVTQASCNVGQQALWSKRIDIGYTDRTLSHFKEKDLSPKARGFIRNSYLEGLDPQEFFFGSMTGRDSLMDTALRTPKSGYLYRRLANALQDLKVEYDKTLRDASGKIVQFEYGEDGKDVSKLHKNEDIASGEAAGIVTAQSFGEPSTQMALNVFHFAGVQEMQVTQGLPRLIEIFDARKNPKTPLMEIYLDTKHNNEKDAKKIAEKIKEVRFEEIVKEIKINFSDQRIEATLNEESVKSTHVDIKTIVKEMNAKKGISIKKKGNTLYSADKDMGYKELYVLKEKLKKTVVSGIKKIDQVLVVKRDRNYVILTSGSNLKKVLKIQGVSKEKTTTNDLYEIEEVLGIEAARQAVINEVYKVLNQQGLDIDERHIKLIADAMTYKGNVKGITRMGIISEKSSVLARSAFETPIKQFINASIRGDKDQLESVIENIILNQPVPVGTGLPGLLVEVTGPLAKQKKGKKK